MGQSGRPAALPAPAPTRPAGIKDVAALAGVSLKTVTNVVHERPNVSPATRAKVRSAIEQLDYTPSMAGRLLRSGRSNMITLAVPRIDEPYLGGLSHAMIAAATRRGYSVLVDETGGHPEREETAANGYPGHGIDGVIFSPNALDPANLAARSHHVPMVLLAEHLAGSSADYVAIDNDRSALEVVAHLVSRGRRRIAYLGHHPGWPTGSTEQRRAGYEAGLRAVGIEPRPNWLLQTGRFSRDEGRRATMANLKVLREVDAVICGSDLLALGAMRGLAEVGLSVPDDIAVVGWDDIIDGEYHRPSLTSVAPDLVALATTAIDALITRIEGDRSEGRRYVVPYELIVRESSGTTG